MLTTRVIPCLLLQGSGLVKTVKFTNPRYVGDPINAVRIFNEKEVDELVFLDITATREGREPNFDLVRVIAGETFMPFGYGGGISNLDHIKRLFSLGVEKVILNSAPAANTDLVTEAAALAGSQSIVVSIDAKQNIWGKYIVYTHGGTVATKQDPVSYARQMERAGAGEILLNAIERDGTMSGYDLDLIRMVSESVGVPVVAVGGAGELHHFREAVDYGASAVAAGSMFVFHGKRRAVLITYPEYQKLIELFGSTHAV